MSKSLFRKRQVKTRSRIAGAARVAVESLESRCLFSATVYGHVYYDTNHDGSYTSGVDQAVPSQTVVFHEDNSTPDQNAVTDINGRWQATLYNTQELSVIPNSADVACGWSAGLLGKAPVYVENPNPITNGNTYGPFDFLILSDGTAVTTLPKDTNSTCTNCDCTSVSAKPVRYGDGTVLEGATDLSSDGYGMSFDQSRYWTNGSGYAQTSINGNGWVSSSLPRLIRGGSQSIAVLLDGIHAEWFDKVSGGYAARHGSKDTLVFGAADDGSGNYDFTLTSANGAQYRFYDVDNPLLPVLQQGAFKSEQVPGAPRIAVSSVDANGNPLVISRTVTVGSDTTVESWNYSYIPTGSTNAGKLASVALVRTLNGSSSPVRSVTYDYYTGAGSGPYSYGTLGDLRSATIRDGDIMATAIDTWYYRYYLAGESNGYAGALKYVVEPEDFARLTAGLMTGDAYSATNASIAAYAARAYQYDSSQRISQETVEGAGSNQTGDGRGTIGYTYCASSNTDGVNSWKTETTETLADGNINLVFTNYLTDVMVNIYEDQSSSQTFSLKKLGTFYHYNANSEVDMEARPSAFSPDSSGNLVDTSSPDLMDQTSVDDYTYLGVVYHDYTYLGNDFGEVDLFTYPTSTSGTISATVAGDVADMLKDTSVRRGDQAANGGPQPQGGAPILESQTQYFAKSYTAGGVTSVIYPLALTSVYPDGVEGSAGTARTTNFTYTWKSDGTNDTNLMASQTQVQPTVFNTEDGPSGTGDTDTTFFDAFGHPIWEKDGDGFITYMAYDAVTGAMTKEIDDVDTSQTGTFANLPSGWTTPSGGGLHLTTTMAVDPFGRPLTLTDPKGNVSYMFYNNPAHEMRTYAGWNPTTHTTTGPVTVVREYYPAANQTTQSLYTETLTANPTFSPTGTVPTGVETIDASNIQSLSRAITNKSGQVVEQDDYFTLSGVTYSQATAALGSANNDSSSGNYHAVLFGYDAAGNQSVTKSLKIGTSFSITRTVFDGQGNPAAVWVGTDDTGATDRNPSNSATAPNDMVKVSDTIYDQSCGCPSSSGVGQPTQIILYPGNGAAARETDIYYDWRGRKVLTKSSVETTEADNNAHEIVFDDLNNLGQVKSESTYDGDGVTITKSNGVPNVTPFAADLRGKTKITYDEQNRPYQTDTYSVDQTTGATSSHTLTSNSWYDRRGNVIKTLAPGGVVNKVVFDGAGREKTQYTTDGGGDHSSSFSCTWTDAGNVTGDNVLEQTDYTYDSDSNVILTTTKQHNHDDTNTGALGNQTTTPKARVYYVADYYDAANRLTDSVDYGTNGGDVLSARPAVVAGRSAVTGTATGGSTTTLVDTSRTEATDSFIGYALKITGGTGSGQTAQITAYNSSTHTFTLDKTLTTALASGSTYSLTPVALVSSDTYDAAGNVKDMTDPKGIVTRTLYDLLDRATSTDAAYVDGTPSAADDQITRYTYDGDDHVLKMTASMPTGQMDQVTQYEYGEARKGVSTLTRSGSVATATFPSNPGYKVGESVVISGATQPEYDGTFVVTGTVSNGFTYTISGSPATTATGTTITARRFDVAYSNDLLSAVHYPVKSGGGAGTANSDMETYSYDGVGGALTFGDQNGNVHSYTYDTLGRQTSDSVTTLGSGVDGTVRRLETAYNTQGLAYQFTSLGANQTPSSITFSGTTATVTLTGHGLAVGDSVQVSGATDSKYDGTFTVTATTSTTFTYTMSGTPAANASGTLLVRKVVNQVQDGFNGLGQMTTEYQAHNGAVKTASTPKIQYVYTEMAGGVNNSRQTKLIYPDGRILRYEYSTGLDNNISRISYLADDASGTVGTHLEDYSYLGLDTIVRETHVQTGTELTYIKQGAEAVGDAGDQYTGLDRFGRVADQRYLTTATGTATDRFQYGYDKDSNPLYKNNLVNSASSELYHANSSASGDDATAYDKLGRLTAFRRGTLSGSANNGGNLDTVTTASDTQSWSLDAIGNQTSTVTNGTTVNNTHNDGNELTVNGASSLAYDAAGNTTTDEIGSTYTYDAWGHQKTGSVPQTYPATESVAYAYDALGRRIKENILTDTGIVPIGGGGTANETVNNKSVDHYFSDEWQMLQDDSSTTSTGYSYSCGVSVWTLTGTCATTFVDHDQNVWSMSYIDDLVERDRVASNTVNPDSAFDSDGKQTTDFSSRTDVAHAVAVQDDGKIVVAGSSTSGTNNDFAIARYNADGSLDTTFGTSGLVRSSIGSAEGWAAIDIEVNGDILVGGFSVNGSGNKDFTLSRYLPNGTLDTTFGTSGITITDFTGTDDVIRGIVEQPDGKIVAVGDTVVSGVHDLALARYSAAGALDSTFGTSGKKVQAAGSGSAYGYGVVLQPDGKIVVGGYDSNTGAGTDMIAARFNTNGSLDDGGGSDSTPGDSFGTSGIATAGFDVGADDHAYSIALVPSGDIVLAGDATSGTSLLMAVAEFTTSGTLDTNFSSDGKLEGGVSGSSANAVAVDGIGRITVAGYGPRAGHSDSDFLLKRFNADGSYDTGFGASGTLQTDFNSGYYDSAYAIALNDTSVVAVGGTGAASATGDFAIAMYTPGGTAVQRVYAQHDANHNVTSLLSTAGTVVQRFTYLPYGQSQVLTSGWTSTSDAYDWAYRFQGGRLETGTGKVYFRNRDYDVTTGTWEEEDPKRYVRGSNLYQYNASNPTGRVDPWGTDEFELKNRVIHLPNGMVRLELRIYGHKSTGFLARRLFGAGDDERTKLVYNRAYEFCECNHQLWSILVSNAADLAQGWSYAAALDDLADAEQQSVTILEYAAVAAVTAGIGSAGEGVAAEEETADALVDGGDALADDAGANATTGESSAGNAAENGTPNGDKSLPLHPDSEAGFPDPEAPTCFLAGTPVLLGDEEDKEAIDQIHVGQRVATDGGVANSPDGKTKSSDPDATDVRRKTWRLVTISAGDWQVQSLQPLSEIKAEHEKRGGSIALSQIVDLQEMGVPDGLVGRVTSIGGCPRIEGGSGRVVLTTVNHLNDFVFHLTLTDAAGTADTIGVTGYHKIYTEDRGWVIASELSLGEEVRTAAGDTKVSSLVRDAGMLRVYNMTVEADHVYYVGDFSALVHNDCVDAVGHHSDPEFMGGDADQELTNMSPDDHVELHRDLNEHLENYSDDAGNTMRPTSNNSGEDIRANFSREERLNAMADFYNDPDIASDYPDAASDFFGQHPGLEN